MMMKYFLFTLFTFLWLIFSCSRNTKEDNDLEFTCAYSELVRMDIQETKKDGTELTVDFQIQLEKNLKKILGSGDLSFTLSDTTFINKTISTKNSQVYYSTSFLERHNAIIGMLCALEYKQFSDSLSIDEKKELEKETAEYRKKYMDLLLNNEEKKEENVDSENNRIDSDYNFLLINHNDSSLELINFIELHSKFKYQNRNAGYKIAFGYTGNINKLSYNNLYRYSGGNLKISVNNSICTESNNLRLFPTLRSGNDKVRVEENINVQIDSLIKSRFKEISKIIIQCLNT